MSGPVTPNMNLSSLPRYGRVEREIFDGQDLISLRTQQLRFERCTFIGTDLRHADLEGCRFKFCDFRNADLRGASLRSAMIAGCDLRGADLRGADLTAAFLGRVNTGTPPHGLTDITGAKLSNALLNELQVDRVIGWDPDEFRPAGTRSGT